MMNKVMILLILSLTGYCNLSFASIETSAYTYEYETGDIGTVRGVANDKPQAFAQAAESCFEQRMALVEKTRGQVTEDQALAIIDSCANMPW